MRSIGLALAIVTVCLAPPALADHMSDGMSAPTAPAPPLYPDLGTWTHRVTTSSPQAQKYFDQGLVLCYGFNHEEAIRAFREAARLDPGCAMAWWGIAYAAGPNINLPMDDDHARIALDAATTATSLAKGVSPVEREYIAAIASRYSGDPKKTRASLDSTYAGEMRALSKRHPDDPDAASMAAEAILDLNPWNQWAHDGSPNPGTLDAVAILEGALKRWPDCPAANHFYIHAVEASPHPERALPAAERLVKLVPGAGHLVHMPSHVYARVGRYDDAVRRNEVAVAVDEKYIADQHPQGVYPLMYYTHNYQFIWFASMMEGRSAEAISASRKVAGNIPPEMIAQMPMLELAPPYPALTLARFGRWSEVLKEPLPPASQRFATGMVDYARGLAFVATGDFDNADAAVDTLLAISRSVPPDMLISINPAGMLLRIAAQDLEGQMAAAQKQPDLAVKSLRAAVATEDSLHYDEPPTFPWPIRPRLGQVLLGMGDAKGAEAEFRADLVRNPENGWALRGLADALRAQKREKEAAAVEERFQKAWARADVKLGAATF